MIEEFLKDIEKYIDQYHIEFIIVHGSALTDVFLENSDIDICIYIKEENKERLNRIRLPLLEEFQDIFDI